MPDAKNKRQPIETSAHFPNMTRRTFLHIAFLGCIAASRRAKSAGQTPEPDPKSTTMNPRLFTFIGGDAGSWTVAESKTIAGEALPVVRKLNLVSGAVAALPEDAKWLLRGVTSNERYVTRNEKDQLVAKQAGLGRPEANCAALIPIRKNAAWWAMTQDERRAIFEERSHHTATGLKYLPAIARRLHHCRDLGASEPFDFLTWFEFAKADAAAFDDLVAELRASEEWKFVERESEIRVARDRA